jgi:YHS domain-containing protein
MLAAVLPDIGRSIRESFFMFWETLWPLVLGFGLSGAVQAFVSEDRIERSLGDHKPASVLRAGGYGMASSSCSYAASAMAKSLFQKGADFISSMVFMVASTNLVIELGIVLAVLMGWQFAAAEFIGGPIMIGLLVIFGGTVFRPRLVELARSRLRAATAENDAARGVPSEVDAERPRPAFASGAGWADAAGYTLADLKMLRRELVFGYIVAGALAVFIPAGAWNALFLRGHGGWTIAENALVGPVIAFASFVCSVGNVPLAAALWKGGIRFGGVVSFVFADLIAAPLVLIYRRYYGDRLTLRLVLLFWGIMAAAGLIVELIFTEAGIVPRHRPTELASTSFHWNATLYLNVVFLGVFASLCWLYRNRERLGGGQGYALDPVCGMQVRTASAPATVVRDGHRYWFCSDRCADQFASSSEHPLPGSASKSAHHQTMEGSEMATDPVCGMTVDPLTATAIRRYESQNYFFCAVGCAEAFDLEPERYVGIAPAAEH